MLHEMIKDCKDELLTLEKALRAVSETIRQGYSSGADLDFLESLDKTVYKLSDRIAEVQEIKASCHRKLELSGHLAKSLELA